MSMQLKIQFMKEKMIILVPINDNEKKRLPNAISSIYETKTVRSFKNNVH